MITEQPAARSRAAIRTSKAMDKRLDGSDVAGRLIQMVLALYLIPALLIVLVIGGVGILAVTVGRLFMGPMPRSVG
jgi:hypothetical protein